MERADGQLDDIEVTDRGGTVACAFGRVGFDQHRRPLAGAGGAPDITTALTIFVVHDDVQRWPHDDTRAGAVQWSDPPGPGWAAMFQILFIPLVSGMRYDLNGVEGIVAVMGTRTEEAVVVTSQPVPLDDDEQDVVDTLRAWLSQQRADDDQVVPYTWGSDGPRRMLWIAPAEPGHREVWDLTLPTVPI